MIPANASPSVNASAVSVGVLFPPSESTSAGLAEFDQLMGEFGQQTISQPAISSQLGTNTTGLLKAASFSVEEERLTPEGLLSSLAVGAGLALQTVLPQSPQTHAVSVQTPSENAAQGVVGGVSAQAPAPALLDSMVNASAQLVLPQLPQTHTALMQTPSEKAAQEAVGGVSAQAPAQPWVDSVVNASAQPVLSQLPQTHTALMQTPSEKAAQGVVELVPAQTPAQPLLDSVVNASAQPVLPQSSQTHTALMQTPSEKAAQGVVGLVPAQALSENKILGLVPALQSATDNLVLGATATQGSVAVVNTTDATKPMTFDASGELSLLGSSASTKTPSSVSPLILSANAVLSPMQSMNTSLPTPQVSPLAADIATLQSQLIQAETELTQSRPILGENRAIVFATQSATTGVMASGVMQAASTTTDASPSMSQANAFAVIAANLTAAANSAAQDQTKDQSTERQWTPFSEDAASELPSESSSDEFSVTLAGSLTPSATQNSILASPLNMRQPQWTQDVSQRVQVMVNQSMNELEVRLDPLDLGPMKIKLALDEQQKAHVTLSAAHGLTRDMLENALPRLKELLAQEGIELASATVNSGQEQSGNEQDRSQRSHASTSDMDQDAVTTTVVMNKSVISENIVDQFV
ncbi:MAG: flagellar hook-length control protein FliK [Gammaproteobacteria bacterium]|nr:flagellar hook-length control protein FliK [Gammaproteobacteria bacterium]